MLEMAFRDTCVVLNAGILPDGRAALLLKSSAFPAGRNFKSTPGQARETLAVALAAITSNKQVYCDIPDETVEWSEVQQFNLLSGQ
jgi:hypothetical protein